MKLTAQQWALIEPLLPPEDLRPRSTGRPRAPARVTLEGILWLLSTGAPWKDLPKRYGSYPTVCGRLRAWLEQGALGAILHTLAQDLKANGKLDAEAVWIEGLLTAAKERSSPRHRSRGADTPSSGLYRRPDHSGWGWLWQVRVEWQQRRIDRHFYHATYGCEAEAEAMAQAWRDALIDLFTTAAKMNLSDSVIEHKVAAMNARFDALRPRWIFLRVYIVHLEGIPCQLRALVSDRGQDMQRREIGANFRSRTLDEALALMRDRIDKVMVRFFGPEVAQAFMAAHGRAFTPTNFDPAVGIEIRERVDRYENTGKAPAARGRSLP